jgi:hypothetical protein
MKGGTPRSSTPVFDPGVSFITPPGEPGEDVQVARGVHRQVLLARAEDPNSGIRRHMVSPCGRWR